MSLPGMSAAGLHGHRVVVPGSQTFTASGNFTVPEYDTLTVTLFGGGAGGAGGAEGGASGVSSTFQGLTAGGGVSGTTTVGGVGGTASGGNVSNDTGSAGGNQSPGTANGGACPGGGGTSTNGQNHGNIQGGGGGGGGPVLDASNAGGGGAARCRHSYAAGALTVGASLSVTVGTGGPGGATPDVGGNGARGEVQFVWS